MVVPDGRSQLASPRVPQQGLCSFGEKVLHHGFRALLFTEGGKMGTPFPHCLAPWSHPNKSHVFFLDVNHHPKSIKSDDEIGGYLHEVPSGNLVPRWLQTVINDLTFTWDLPVAAMSG